MNTKTQNNIEIVSWNVNSVNARIENILKFISQYNPYIMLLQETKSTEVNFPFSIFEDLGYNVYASYQKAYNGVAILSKCRVEDLHVGLLQHDEEARYIEGCVYPNNGKNCIRVASIYVPNGNEVDSPKFSYKLRFLEALEKRIEALNSTEELASVFAGDFNVAPDIVDVWDPVRMSRTVGFHIEERERLRKIMYNNSMLDGWRVLYPDAKEVYSWWDYRTRGIEKNRGMRIDNMLLSPSAMDILHDAKIYKVARTWKRPSDHAPLSVILNLKSERHV